MNKKITTAGFEKRLMTISLKTTANRRQKNGEGKV